MFKFLATWMLQYIVIAFFPWRAFLSFFDQPGYNNYEMWGKTGSKEKIKPRAGLNRNQNLKHVSGGFQFTFRVQ